MSSLSPIAEQICQKRYYKKDENGNCIEDWKGLVTRVVNHVCKNESVEFKDKIFDLIYTTKFLPNSPCLVNAGKNTKSKGLMACFVTKAPEDSWNGMIENIANFGHVARQGGGCGVSFSNIRPAGDPVFGSTHAKACGPIEHMRMISEVMASITQSGFRGMAMMSTLNVSHPDIEKFIVCKQREAALRSFLKEDISNQYERLVGQTHEHLNIVLDKFISNFNISVFATDEFMNKVEKDEDFELKFNGKIYKTVKAREIFDAIVKNAWRNGDPGMLFDDTINNGSPYRFSKQRIQSTNPCSEQILPDYGSCNLGSIDVSKFYCKETSRYSWSSLREAIRAAVQFLDNVTDANTFPTEKFANWSKDNRPVGLGIMGWADLLLNMEIVYGSDESLSFANKMAKFFYDEAHQMSIELGNSRGTPKCCNFKELDYRRNATVISIAPTGTISLLAGCSSAIEPVFATTIYRTDNTGSYSMPHPHSSSDFFRCAVCPDDENKEVNWKQHIDMQAAFQKYCDSSISKTVNMRNSATVDDVKNAYMYAWKSGCRGITVYRDGCKTTQVLNTEKKTSSYITADAPKRPKEVTCEVHKTKASGYDWHIIVGRIDNKPYEVFAVNGRVDLPKTGKVIKTKKRHYSFIDDNNNILIDNLNDEEEIIDKQLGWETRRFSLEMRHGVPIKYIIQQVDKSNAPITSFTKAVARVLSKYISDEDKAQMVKGQPCPECTKEGKSYNMVYESGCSKCPTCHYSRCG